MSRVSVATAQKPKPKTTFKFLRRDEGRLSYSLAAAESPMSRSADTPRTNREQRDSKSLREAIAYDMRNAKSHDPLGEVVVAIPKKAPPSSQQGQVGAGIRRDSPLIRGVPRTRSLSRPEWVVPELPGSQRDMLETRREQATASDSNDVYASPQDGNINLDPYKRDANGSERVRRGESYEADSRYNGTPRYTAGPQPRYADPELKEMNRNYFRQPPPLLQHLSTATPAAFRAREEEDLMLQLEQEVRAAQDERAWYTHAKHQLDREKQQFSQYRFSVQQQMQDERADLDALRAKDQCELRKGVKSMEERYKNVSSLLSTEREASRRLMQENESLRTQLEELTSTLRVTQKNHTAEVARMRRVIDSLTRRNSELLAMAKECQIDVLEISSSVAGTPAPVTAASSVPSCGSTRSSAVPGGVVGSSMISSGNPEGSLAVQDAPGSSFVETEVPTRCNVVSGTPSLQPLVLDFTTRIHNDTVWKRRAKEVEERMEREELERQQRRQQRERVTAERKAKEEEEAARRASEEEKTRASKAEEAAAARKKREGAQAAVLPKRQQRAEMERRPGREASQAPPAEVSKERKVAGHPLHTPRVTTTSNTKTLGLGADTAKPPVVPPKPKPCIPTREVLLEGVEPLPTEDFPNDEIVSQTTLGDNPNKREVLYRSGKRMIHYANGTIRTVLPTGHTILHFTNGDVKCTFPSNKSTYWYAAAQTTHIQLPDGVQLFEFLSTGQTERHMPDGTKEILYPDGTYKTVHPDGTDSTYFPDEQ